MKSGKVFLSVLAGVATGTALGVLFAPDKGSSTRRKISNRTNHYANGIKDKSNAIAEGVSQKFQAVKNEGSRIVDNLRHKTKETETDLKRNM